MARDKPLVNLSGGELDPDLQDRVDLEQYQRGFRTLLNCIQNPKGAIINRPGTQFVKKVATEYPFQKAYDSGDHEDPLILENFYPGNPHNDRLPDFKFAYLKQDINDPDLVEAFKTAQDQDLATGDQVIPKSVGSNLAVSIDIENIFVSTRGGFLRTTPSNFNESTIGSTLKNTFSNELRVTGVQTPSMFFIYGNVRDGVGEYPIPKQFRFNSSFDATDAVFYLLPHVLFKKIGDEGVSALQHVSPHDYDVDDLDERPLETAIYAIGLILDGQELVFRVNAFLNRLIPLGEGSQQSATPDPNNLSDPNNPWGMRDLYIRPPLSDDEPNPYNPDGSISYPNGITNTTLFINIGRASNQSLDLISTDGHFINEVRFYKALLPINFSNSSNYTAYGLIGRKIYPTRINDTNFNYEFVDTGIKPDFANAPPEFNVRNERGVPTLGIFERGDGFKNLNIIDGSTTHTIYKQRLLLSSGRNLETSRIEYLQNFRRDYPIDGDSALSIKADYPIRHLVKTNQGLLIFTDEKIFIKSDGFSEVSLDYTNGGDFIADRDLTPLVTPDGILFLDDRGVIRSLFWSRESRKFLANKLSIFSQHIFEEKKITSWTYQSGPKFDFGVDSSYPGVIWGTLNDGSPFSLVYDPEQKISSFSRHKFHNPVKWVVSTGNIVYWIMVSSESGFYEVHRMSEGLNYSDIGDAGTAEFPMDGSLLVKSENIHDDPDDQFIDGLDHLEGRKVTIVVNGELSVNGLLTTREEYTVQGMGGSISTALLRTAGRRIKKTDEVWIGVPIINDIETLSIKQLTDRFKFTTKLIVTKVNVGVTRGRQLYVGSEFPKGDNPIQDMKKLIDYDITSETLDPEEPTLPNIEKTLYPVRIGGSWKAKGRIAIRNIDPYPFKIRSIIPDVTEG